VGEKEVVVELESWTMSASETATTDAQRRAKSVRNVCIVAHVDHGKTTLSDSLVASNGTDSSVGLVCSRDATV